VQLACLEMAVSGCFYLIKTGQFCSLLSKFKCLSFQNSNVSCRPSKKAKAVSPSKQPSSKRPIFADITRPQWREGAGRAFFESACRYQGLIRSAAATSIAASMRVAAAKLDSGVVDMKIDCPLRHPELAGICADDLPRATHVSAPISRSASRVASAPRREMRPDGDGITYPHLGN